MKKPDPSRLDRACVGAPGLLRCAPCTSCSNLGPPAPKAGALLPRYCGTPRPENPWGPFAGIEIPRPRSRGGRPKKSPVRNGPGLCRGARITPLRSVYFVLEPGAPCSQSRCATPAVLRDATPRKSMGSVRRDRDSATAEPREKAKKSPVRNGPGLCRGARIRTWGPLLPKQVR